MRFSVFGPKVFKSTRTQLLKNRGFAVTPPPTLPLYYPLFAVPPYAESVTADNDELCAGAANSDDGVRPDRKIGHHLDLVDVPMKDIQ